jgi:large subunit ribosomal protein L25
MRVDRGLKLKPLSTNVFLETLSSSSLVVSLFTANQTIRRTMKLNASTCSRNSKRDIKLMKLDGYIPAIIYRKGAASEKIRILKKEFEAHLRHIEKGHLATTVFTVHAHGKDEKMVVKGIEYAKTTYEVLHIDFQPLTTGLIKVRVPVVLQGEKDCEAVKAGFSLKQAKRFVRVEAPVNAIPANFMVDVRNLQPREKVRISSLGISENVRVLAAENELVVTASK